LLELEDVVVRYGPAVAVDGVSLHVVAGDPVALIGPNGAGKLTMLDADCGVCAPASGHVGVDGRDVTGWAPGRIVARGLTQVPEGRQVFPTLPGAGDPLLGAH